MMTSSDTSGDGNWGTPFSASDEFYDPLFEATSNSHAAVAGTSGSDAFEQKVPICGGRTEDRTRLHESRYPHVPPAYPCGFASACGRSMGRAGIEPRPRDQKLSVQ
jgi:hypothetical protein